MAWNYTLGSYLWKLGVAKLKHSKSLTFAFASWELWKKYFPTYMVKAVHIKFLAWTRILVSPIVIWYVTSCMTTLLVTNIGNWWGYLHALNILMKVAYGGVSHSAIYHVISLSLSNIHGDSTSKIIWYRGYMKFSIIWWYIPLYLVSHKILQ